MSQLKRFRVEREPRPDSDGSLTLRLSGALDGHVKLAQELGDLETATSLIVACRGITFIDSVGAREWLRVFTAATKRGQSLVFSECPPPVVEQLNLLGDFDCGGRVVSVALPFVCQACGNEYQGVTRTENLRRLGYKVPSIKCLRCGRKASFQETPEEYFSFLIRSERPKGPAGSPPA